MEMTLHTAQDDLNLRSTGDLERQERDDFTFEYNLVDEASNQLVDEAGNNLVAMFHELLFPQVLHSTQDDLNLNTE